eukprot:5765918-Pyramimonas_sp.AAC.1
MYLGIALSLGTCSRFMQDHASVTRLLDLVAWARLPDVPAMGQPTRSACLVLSLVVCSWPLANFCRVSFFSLPHCTCPPFLCFRGCTKSTWEVKEIYHRGDTIEDHDGGYRRVGIYVLVGT